MGFTTKEYPGMHSLYTSPSFRSRGGNVVKAHMERGRRKRLSGSLFKCHHGWFKVSTIRRLHVTRTALDKNCYVVSH